jgi:hypothetical protein
MFPILDLRLERELRRWCSMPRRLRELHEDSAVLRELDRRAWLREVRKQEASEVDASEASTDLHSVAGSFGGCSCHFGTT